MKPISLILFVLLFCSMFVCAQNSYIYTDTTSYFGVKIIDNGEKENARICQVTFMDSVITYTPNDIKEYRFRDGRVYISKEISTGDIDQQVFLERLYKGETSLYFYRGEDFKTFFIEKDSSFFVEIPKNSKSGKPYSDLLIRYTKDCQELVDACKLTAYTKRSVREVIKRYNSCENSAFPFIKYGVYLGIVKSDLQLDSLRLYGDMKAFPFKNELNLSLGAFTDIPIFMTDFSVIAGLGLKKSSYSSNYKSEIYDIDILIDMTTMKLPLMVRYNYPALKFKPYFDLGFIYYYNIVNEAVIYKAKLEYDVIQYETPDRDMLISDHQLGYVGGVGFQYYLDYRRALFFEIQYGKDYSLESDKLHNRGFVELQCGITF